MPFHNHNDCLKVQADNAHGELNEGVTWKFVTCPCGVKFSTSIADTATLCYPCAHGSKHVLHKVNRPLPVWKPYVRTWPTLTLAELMALPVDPKHCPTPEQLAELIAQGKVDVK